VNEPPSAGWSVTLRPTGAWRYGQIVLLWILVVFIGSGVVAYAVSGIPAALVTFGVVEAGLITGLRFALRKVSVRLDGAGITASRGRQVWSAQWAEIDEVILDRGTAYIVPRAGTPLAARAQAQIAAVPNRRVIPIGRGQRAADLVEMAARTARARDHEYAPAAAPRMAPTTPPPPAASRAPGAIFISYRRTDNAHAAHRLYEFLTDQFGPGSTFIDLDNIAPGADFVRSIDDAIARSRVLLAIIGPNWLHAHNESGARRLDDPGDFVRLEIERALRSHVRVIPVLADATMPAPSQLPPSLQELSRLNALLLRLESFRADCDHLADQLKRIS